MRGTKTALMRERPPTLKEAQAAVGGFVQMLTLANGDQMLMDEEGKLKRLPVNQSASKRAEVFGPVVGDVLILQGTARWLDDNEEEGDEA